MMDYTKGVVFMRTNSNSLTQGSILKSLLFFALPLFLSNLLQQFYNVFDSWVVGRYLGDTALAAVSSSWSLIGTLIGFFSGTATGAGVLIARYFGAKDYKAMRTAIHTDVAFGLAAGTLLTVLGVTFTPSILRWMDTPETILPESISYFRYYFCGVIFTVMYNILVGILRALGDSKHPLYYLMVSATVNVILDLALVGGPGHGRRRCRHGHHRLSGCQRLAVLHQTTPHRRSLQTENQRYPL